MMTVHIGPLVTADANLARRRFRLRARSGPREAQFQGLSNRMLEVTVALKNAQ
jgi:hypothetical protein